MSHHDSKDSPRNQAERFVQAQYRRDVYERAVRCAHFRPVEAFLIQHVMENGWFKPFFYIGAGPSPVTISCSELGSETPYARSDLQRTLKRLTEWGVLIVQQNGGYLANKEWQSWSRDGRNPIIQLRCYRYIEEARLPHDCPISLESLRIDQVESNGVGTWNHTVESADAADAILNGFGACDAGVTPPPPNCDAGVTHKPFPVTPVSQAAMEPSDPQNGTIVRAPVDIDLQSYSSTLSESDSQSFCSDVCVSYSEEDTTGHQKINASTHTHTKKKNLWGSPSRNGHEIASMLPESREAIPTVKADPVPSLESPPAAPSINDRSPTTMLKEVAGSIEPDAAHWADLEHICRLYCSDMIWNFRSYRFTFPTDVMVGALKRCLLREFDKPRTGPDQSIKISFSYVRSTMSNWKGPEGEADYDRDLQLINPPAVETPGPGAPAAESTNADPYADLMANAPGMYGEWFKDHHVSMSNNPPCKGKPNGKFMDDEDFKRRLVIKARDPDRFVKLSMSYYCPSLIMEREA